MKATFPHVVLCFIPPHSTSYLQPGDLAVSRSFKAASRRERTPLLPAPSPTSFDDVVMNKAWRRLSSRSHGPSRQKPAWTTGWRRLRAHSDGDFRDAATEAAALRARDELFAKHITPEPAEEGSPVWAMAEESDDDEDGTAC